MFVSSFAGLSTFVRRLRNDKSGVTAIEYGLIAGLIAVVIIGTVATIGTDLKTSFTTIANCLTDSTTCAGTGTSGN